MDGYQADRRRLIGAGVVAAGAAALAGKSAMAQGTPASAGGWQPVMEPQDAWLDKPGTRHRMVFDSLSGEGGSEAMGYANNFIHVNEANYGLKPEQLGVVIIFRHASTPYGYNDAMWKKYGAKFATQMELKPKEAMKAASANPALAHSAPDQPLPKGFEWAGNSSLSDLAAKGVRFAVCGLATQAIAGGLAGKDGNAAAIVAELSANLVPGALIVPAGISTVNRAQEHGYSFAYMG